MDWVPESLSVTALNQRSWPHERAHKSYTEGGCYAENVKHDSKAYGFTSQDREQVFAMESLLKINNAEQW